MALLLFVPARTSPTSSTIRIGFVPLVDCAPLVAAKEWGFFRKRGLDVEIQPEPGWASIRDKIVYGELEAAHALAGLCFASTWGLGVQARPCLTGFLFNSHGDAITVSAEMHTAGVKDAESLKRILLSWKAKRPPTFAVPHLYSSHLFLLRQWMRPVGIVPGRDVEIVTLPPSLMPTSLQSGHIDGYCVGEPFNSVATSNGSGKVVAESALLSPLHPEKAFLVSKEFASVREDEHLALIGALYEAAQLCDTPSGRSEMADILARREYLNCDHNILRNSLLPAKRNGSEFVQSEEFHIFGSSRVNRPSSEKSNWIISELRLAGALESIPPGNLSRIDEIFRADLFDRATASPPKKPARQKPRLRLV